MAEAEEISSELARVGADGVAVFGSVARGTATFDSDLDLLVLWNNDHPIPVLPDQITLPDTDTHWNLIQCRSDRLAKPGIRWSLYRQVAAEAVYLHDNDGQFQGLLDQLSRGVPDDFYQTEGRYLERKLADLRAEGFTDADECYKWAKAAIMQMNLVDGVTIGDRGAAIEAFAERYPRLQSDARRLENRDNILISLGEATERLLSFASDELLARAS